MPLTYTPTSTPPESTVYIWIDENGTLKSMDNSGTITDYTGADTSALEVRIAANEGVIDSHSDDLGYIQNDLISGIDQDIEDLGDELEDLETEIESVGDLAQAAKERADDAYVLAGEGGGGGGGSETITALGNVTGSNIDTGTWRAAKTGNIVVFQFSNLRSSSSTAEITSDVVIPEEFRPEASITDMYNSLNAGSVRTQINANGTFSCKIREWDGGLGNYQNWGGASLTYIVGLDE